MTHSHLTSNPKVTERIHKGRSFLWSLPQSFLPWYVAELPWARWPRPCGGKHPGELHSSSLKVQSLINGPSHKIKKFRYNFPTLFITKNYSDLCWFPRSLSGHFHWCLSSGTEQSAAGQTSPRSQTWHTSFCHTLGTQVWSYVLSARKFGHMYSRHTRFCHTLGKQAFVTLSAHKFVWHSRHTSFCHTLGTQGFVTHSVHKF